MDLELLRAHWSATVPPGFVRTIGLPRCSHANTCGTFDTTERGEQRFNRVRCQHALNVPGERVGGSDLLVTDVPAWPDEACPRRPPQGLSVRATRKRLL